LLSDGQKKFPIDALRKLLSMPGMYAEHHFERMAIGDESLFQYSFYSDLMPAVSNKSIMARIRQDSSGQNTLIAIVFPSTRLMVLEALPQGTKFDQNDFIHAIFPGLYIEKTRISHKNGFPVFQFTWMIRCVIMVTRSLRNLP
jgi:hypothetical protein